jgi:hypothetical protein
MKCTTLVKKKHREYVQSTIIRRKISKWNGPERPLESSPVSLDGGTGVILLLIVAIDWSVHSLFRQFGNISREACTTVEHISKTSKPRSPRPFKQMNADIIINLRLDVFSLQRRPFFISIIDPSAFVSTTMGTP